MVEINADSQDLQEAARRSAADQLRESAEDVDTNDDSATTTP